MYSEILYVSIIQKKYLNIFIQKEKRKKNLTIKNIKNMKKYLNLYQIIVKTLLKLKII